MKPGWTDRRTDIHNLAYGMMALTNLTSLFELTHVFHKALHFNTFLSLLLVAPATWFLSRSSNKIYCGNRPKQPCLWIPLPFEPVFNSCHCGFSRSPLSWTSGTWNKEKAAQRWSVSLAEVFSVELWHDLRWKNAKITTLVMSLRTATVPGVSANPSTGLCSAGGNNEKSIERHQGLSDSTLCLVPVNSLQAAGPLSLAL